MRDEKKERKFYDALVELLQTIVCIEPTGRFEFSRYVNGPPGTAGVRTFVHVKARELTTNWLRKTTSELSVSEELALNSRYLTGKHLLHLPMIDFLSAAMNELHMEKLREYSESLDAPWLLVDSGNSFHAYFGCLLSEMEWRSYLGTLLLQTPPVYDGKPLPIDVRWVGHSMINGFSALRCSCNTTRYRHIPYFVAHGMPRQRIKSEFDIHA